MQKVFVLDKNKKPLMPCTAFRARELLAQGKATLMKQFGIAYIYNWCKNNHSDQTCLLIKEIEEKFGKANLNIRKGSELIIDESFLEYYKNIEI